MHGRCKEVRRKGIFCRGRVHASVTDSHFIQEGQVCMMMEYY